jgi:Coenzyme PQQ synthesis protein D (PqqD)
LEKMDDEFLLFDPAHTKILYCNETASLIWQLCDGTRNAQEIIATLSNAYPDAADVIANDVDATLKLFLENGAIEYV